ncbi:C4-dicarboxylate ABC transporter [Aureimonas endophytica]|uniref:C4-dicarboxylate ABC transporter n=1 Tax=Aureimonas endophytica TaxID=2027858 RepID=A0A917E3F9_9HYPH|nr:tripartite tricarboxylate transporter TctB family protein [Aureimonas endophytica]GGD99968.1 C4-dicarboxylate ABC transporter [Aureimonas endophytica]
MTETSSPERERRPDWAAAAIGLGLAVVAVVVAWNAYSLRGGAYATVGPKSFPYVVAAALAILSVWTLVEAWRGDFPKRDHDELGPIFWIVAGLAAQLLLLKPAGFSIATGLLFACAAAAFGKRRLWLTIPIGIALAFVIWMVFTRLLKLALPGGPLERLVF